MPVAGGELFIEQRYELYSEQQQESWRRLYRRMIPHWREFANERFLEGLECLRLDSERIPRLESVNRVLDPLTGFRARAVSGYVPAYLFFDCLRRRQFPTTVTIRRAENLDYLPEPDIFHDVAGHVPMHTDRRFAETLVQFGNCAQAAVELTSAIGDRERRRRTVENIVKAMARFFWFTVEFGLIRQDGRLRAYGSGLLSSYGELEHSLMSTAVQRYPIQLEWVINQAFGIDHFQPLLFVIESFDQLFELVNRLERWMRKGKLDQVAPGEPAVHAADIESFASV